MIAGSKPGRCTDSLRPCRWSRFRSPSMHRFGGEPVPITYHLLGCRGSSDTPALRKVLGITQPGTAEVGGPEEGLGSLTGGLRVPKSLGSPRLRAASPTSPVRRDGPLYTGPHRVDLSLRGAKTTRMRYGPAGAIPVVPPFWKRHPASLQPPSSVCRRNRTCRGLRRQLYRLVAHRWA